MQIGLFYEHQLPRPWTDRSESQLLYDALDQCELADRIGIDCVWEVEHHFLEEYSHSSAPEVFLAAASQRTKRLRLGHGVVQTPPPFNHPARVAERLAMLDLVSDGRVEFGTGEASSIVELGGFGINYDDKRAMWEEGLRVALRCMTEEPFTGFAGEHVMMPPRNIVPKPAQKPHPPVWVACSRRETMLLAAQHGIGALTFAFVDPEDARRWVEEYHRTLAARAVPIGDAVNPRIASVTTFMCHEDEAVALERGAEGSNFFGYSLSHFYLHGRHEPGVTDVWEEFQRTRAEQGFVPATESTGAPLAAKTSEGSGLRGAVGTPEQIRDFLGRYEEAGIDQVILVSQAGRNRHEDIMESLELFGREVLPEFAERHERDEPHRRARLEPVIEAAIARKPESDHPLIAEGYTVPATARVLADDADSADLHAWLDEMARRQAVGEDSGLGDLLG